MVPPEMMPRRVWVESCVDSEDDVPLLTGVSEESGVSVGCVSGETVGAAGVLSCDVLSPDWVSLT